MGNSMPRGTTMSKACAKGPAARPIYWCDITSERAEGASMGKGDRRTRRGKIYNGSHGKKRPGKPKKATESGGQTSSAPLRAGKPR